MNTDKKKDFENLLDSKMNMPLIHSILIKPYWFCINCWNSTYWHAQCGGWFHLFGCLLYVGLFPFLSKGVWRLLSSLYQYLAVFSFGPWWNTFFTASFSTWKPKPIGNPFFSLISFSLSSIFLIHLPIKSLLIYI